MGFVPTQEQVDSLYLLLTQFVRENEAVRVIRFIERFRAVEGHMIEVVCIEDIDRYIIKHDGRIVQKD